MQTYTLVCRMQSCALMRFVTTMPYFLIYRTNNTIPSDWSLWDHSDHLQEAFERVIYRSYNPSYPIHTFTFLRLGESLLSSRNWQNFVRFVKIMCSKSNGSGRSGSKCGDLCKSLWPASLPILFNPAACQPIPAAKRQQGKLRSWGWIVKPSEASIAHWFPHTILCHPTSGRRRDATFVY